MPRQAPTQDRSAAVDAVFASLTHFIGNAVIGTAVRCNLADHLDNGPLTADELAGHANLHPISTTRILRFLASFGVFREVSPAVFANTDASNLLRNRPGGLRNLAWFVSSDQVIRSVAGLRHGILTGESPFQHVTGESFWDYLGSHPEDAEAFNRMFAEIGADEHVALTNAYDWSGFRVVVDVGGGNGSLLATILRKHLHLRGIVFDQEGVLPSADEHLTERGVRERCDLVKGSFFSGIGVTGDVWLLSQILHDWSDSECRIILENIGVRMSAVDRLLVAEMVTVPCNPDPVIGMLDMQMLTLFGNARQRTVDEYRDLFSCSGLQLTSIIPAEGRFSILEARKL
jgi:hypothetical protein